MASYILTFDLGTSSERAIVFNHDFNIVGMEQREFPQHYPSPGRVEQDPMDIWNTQLSITNSLLKKLHISTKDIAGIGITNQRETTVVWNRHTGQPVYPAIVWQDKRTAAFCEILKAKKYSAQIQEKTGLIIDAYFSATKLHWILNYVPGARVLAEKGDLLFGTVDTWIIWKLSGGALHITDVSNASRTMLYNINTLEWDADLLALFDIPAAILPSVHDSSEIYGKTAEGLFGKGRIPITGIAGDQQAALFGQGCLSPGMAKNTYGTGCFMLMNTGGKAVKSNHGLLTTIAWGIEGKITYALEGSVFIAGAAIQWLRDNLHLIKTVAESEAAACAVQDTSGVYFIPAFSGLGAPYWDMHVRGTLCGLTQGSSDKHIIRAALEAIAYQSKDVLDAMECDSGVKLEALNVDGGATGNNFLMQFQADILPCPVFRVDIVESTALGAALLAGLACGFWTLEDIPRSRGEGRCFKPNMPENTRRELYRGWLRAVKQARTCRAGETERESG
ncbi:MAG: glycerol kinase GlpK [Candidatus Marinimicrobia bacterium]|nr:glycerol kinase GlpK [Candidatus Neomarinimicrobiota bacterium]